jgi:hypothetical protein
MQITVYEASTGDIVTDQCRVTVGVLKDGRWREVYDVPYMPDQGWAFARIESTVWRGYELIHRDVLLASDGVVLVEQRTGL